VRLPQSIIPALGKVRQEDHKFQVSLSYIVRPYLEKKKKEDLTKI
jgi:hypothetical protein